MTLVSCAHHHIHAREHATAHRGRRPRAPSQCSAKPARPNHLCGSRMATRQTQKDAPRVRRGGAPRPTSVGRGLRIAQPLAGRTPYGPPLATGRPPLICQIRTGSSRLARWGGGVGGAGGAGRRSRPARRTIHTCLCAAARSLWAMWLCCGLCLLCVWLCVWSARARALSLCCYTYNIYHIYMYVT